MRPIMTDKSSVDDLLAGGRGEGGGSSIGKARGIRQDNEIAFGDRATSKCCVIVRRHFQRHQLRRPERQDSAAFGRRYLS